MCEHISCPINIQREISSTLSTKESEMFFVPYRAAEQRRELALAVWIWLRYQIWYQMVFALRFLAGCPFRFLNAAKDVTDSTKSV